MAIAKSAVGTEAEADSLIAIVDKALGYPRKGTHAGRGPHVQMPDTWDGKGETPPGWTKRATSNWIATASDACVPIPDTLAAELQRPANLAKLTAGEATTLNTALASRVNVELDGRTPKASAAVVAAEEEKRT